MWLGLQFHLNYKRVFSDYICRMYFSADSIENESKTIKMISFWIFVDLWCTWNWYRKETCKLFSISYEQVKQSYATFCFLYLPICCSLKLHSKAIYVSSSMLERREARSKPYWIPLVAFHFQEYNIIVIICNQIFWKIKLTDWKTLWHTIVWRMFWNQIFARKTDLNMLALSSMSEMRQSLRKEKRFLNLMRWHWIHNFSSQHDRIVGSSCEIQHKSFLRSILHVEFVHTKFY